MDRARPRCDGYRRSGCLLRARPSRAHEWEWHRPGYRTWRPRRTHARPHWRRGERCRSLPGQNETLTITHGGRRVSRLQEHLAERRRRRLTETEPGAPAGLCGSLNVIVVLVRPRADGGAPNAVGEQSKRERTGVVRARSSRLDVLLVGLTHPVGLTLHTGRRQIRAPARVLGAVGPAVRWLEVTRRVGDRCELKLVVGADGVDVDVRPDHRTVLLIQHPGDERAAALGDFGLGRLRVDGDPRWHRGEGGDTVGITGVVGRRVRGRRRGVWFAMAAIAVTPEKEIFSGNVHRTLAEPPLTFPLPHCTHSGSVPGREVVKRTRT